MNDQALARLVRRADPDRFLGVLFAPPARRRDLLTLYALNHELARAREVASEGPMALIRLHWWREMVEGADRDHPVAKLVREVLERGVVAVPDLVALIDAREAEAEPMPDLASFLAYVRGTAGRLARLSGMILGISDGAELAALDDIGAGYAITRIIGTAEVLQRLGRDLLPQDGTEIGRLLNLAATLVAPRVSPQARPVAILSVLARRDLARLRAKRPLTPRGLGDQVAVMRYMMVPRLFSGPGALTPTS